MADLKVPSIQGAKPEVKFHLIKSNSFRVVLAEGVYGGSTPRGMIQMTFFNERAAIPNTITHEVTLTGSGQKIGEIKNRTGKDGFVRELEVDVMMNLPSAKSFHAWLGKHIEQLEKRQQSGAGKLPVERADK